MGLPRIFRKRRLLNALKSYRKHRLLTFAVTGAALICVILLIIILLKRQPTAEAAGPPPEVEVVEVEQKDVPTYGEWIAFSVILLR